MKEVHPFDCFVPDNARYLILGSFTGRQATRGDPTFDESYDWFYGTKRNQFWPILEAVYGVELKSKSSKQALFTQLGIAIADIIQECERRDHTNLDSNLVCITYATQMIAEILDHHPIQKIFFTSRFVETHFKRHFQEIFQSHPNCELICLPSPSPRYATLSKGQKVQAYSKLLL